jgi:hypothetical protein
LRNSAAADFALVEWSKIEQMTIDSVSKSSGAYPYVQTYLAFKIMKVGTEFVFYGLLLGASKINFLELN